MSQSKREQWDSESTPEADETDDVGLGGRMSFVEHLEELRKRLIWSVASVGLGFAITIFFVNDLFAFIMRPMQRLLPAGQRMIYTDPGEAFGLEIKVALIAGLIIASPMVFAQLWLFVAPGLYSREKKWALPFIAMSSFFFVVGAAFAHYVVFPIVWVFFVNFTNDFMTFTPRVEPAFSMYLRLVLALGITFQLPTLVLFLARMGMITSRFMIKNFKFALLLIAIVAAVLSPDGGGIGMLAMGGPVVVLYVVSIGLAWGFGKKRGRRAAAHESELLLFFVAANWIGRRCLDRVFPKTVT